jgi:hypothetical protein
VDRFEVENLVQQWYDDMGFSRFGFGYDAMAGPSTSCPLPFDSPPPTHPLNDEDNEGSGEESEDDW